jgi:hypothetical protein
VDDHCCFGFCGYCWIFVRRAPAAVLMRFGTMGTTSLGLDKKEQGGCYESAHSV